jgi:hypothetical protein
MSDFEKLRSDAEDKRALDLHITGNYGEDQLNPRKYPRYSPNSKQRRPKKPRLLIDLSIYERGNPQ